jgi:hypothetical protein
MKKRIIFAAFVAALLLLVGAGCALPIWSELFGTWELSSGGVTESLKFGTVNFTYELSGASTGTLKCSIDDVNDLLNHVQLTVTSATGDWSSTPIGTVYLMTYRISGNSLYWDWSTTAYPASATIGPYTK